MPSEFLISAAHKSSGKTLISIGLSRAIADRGIELAVFKKGPDYIDPMWLSRAAGSPCYNLDFNTQSNDEIVSLYQAKQASVSLIEGNKGLYDSVDIEGRHSNAALAGLLKLPVILVIDCAGITRGIAPLLQGYLNFEPVDIRGVILNKTVGSRHESKLTAAVAEYTDVEVMGCVPRTPELSIDERYLGLIPGNEHTESEQAISKIATAISAGVEIDTLLDTCVSSFDAGRHLPEPYSGQYAGLRVGIARDEAFGFYYADDVDEFCRAGVELVPFSPLKDSQLPRVDALFIGGGFPERLAEKLSGNQAMLGAVRSFAMQQGVIYAECGGLMYLGQSIRERERKWPMAGVLPVETIMHRRPVGRGLVRVCATSQHPWGLAVGDPICAHEFHYSEAVMHTKDNLFAYSVQRGHGVDGRHDGLVLDNVLATYVHQRHTRQNPWISSFLNFVSQKTGNKHVDQTH